LIAHHYPNGFENDHLVSFTTPKGEFIKALEIRTEDTIYLFKIDKNMEVDDDENHDSVSMGDNDFDSFKNDNSDDDDDDDDNESDNADTDDGTDDDED
jgi:hypothetical protein